MYAYLSEDTPHVCRSPWKSEEGIKFPGTGVTEGCEISVWALETEPGSSARTAKALGY